MGKLQHFRDTVFTDIATEYVPDIFDKNRLKDFFIHFLQLAGILAIVNYYEFEKTSGIATYCTFILLLFAIYSFTPIKYKPSVFFFGIVFIILHAFGPLSGCILLFTGLAFIAICHLKIAHILKLSIILILFGGLAFLRSDILYVPRLAVLISYLMPMFMFRIFIYLYELKHGLRPKSLWQSVTYFFMLPNIFFLFYPIIDYKTYIKTYYNVPEKDVWQKGIRWMLRGLCHIFVYRLLCTYFLTSTSDVHDLPSLTQYLLSNYSLLVRMSGIFHFTIGLLCMFGMNLPQVFDNYFIATGFADLWRRINIYWKDFILKIFFYPIMFVYKKRIKTFLLPATMMSAFFITFLLHGYQLFFVTGTFNLRMVDLIFWMVMGILVTINSIYIEQKALSVKKFRELPALLHYLINTLKISGVILTMSVLWSLWISKTMADWLFLMKNITIISWFSISGIILSILAILLTGVIIHYLVNLKPVQKIIQLPPSRTFFLTAPTIAFLLLLQAKTIRTVIPPQFISVVNTISNDSPNKVDKAEAETGYYDRLIEGSEGITVRIGNKNFKTVINRNPYATAYYHTDGILERRIKPNLNIKGLNHDFITNSYGMRDKEYPAVKGDSIYRMTLIGASYEMGSGVSNHEIFESITENRLNENFPDSSYKSIEIWNFAVAGYYLMEQLQLLKSEVFKFKPDAVIYFAHSGERFRMVKNMTSVIKRKIPIEDKFLNDIIKLAGIKPYMPETQIRQLLTPYIDCILQWSYMEMAAMSKKHHTKIIWVYLLTTDTDADQDEYDTIRHFAKQAGYITMDLGDVYGDVPRESIQVSDINPHPNASGQKLIADRFYEEILNHKKEIFSKKP
jgi:hypothetical protein